MKMIKFDSFGAGGIPAVPNRNFIGEPVFRVSDNRWSVDYSWLRHSGTRVNLPKMHKTDNLPIVTLIEVFLPNGPRTLIEKVCKRFLKTTFFQKANFHKKKSHKKSNFAQSIGDQSSLYKSKWTWGS